MHLLELQCSEEEAYLVVAELFDHGVVGLEQQSEPDGATTLRAWFEFRVEIGDFARWNARWAPVEPTDWEAVSRAQWDTVLVGRRFFLVPEWRDDPAPEGRLRLAMRPGRACGTGWAAPTQLALECMEREVRPGATVVDVGTGAGILASAAALLGAGRLIACDIDHDCLPEARARFALEGLPVLAFTGSLRALRDASADLLLCNLTAATLIDLAPEMRRVLRSGGAAICGGFRERDLERVQRALGVSDEPCEKDGWLILVMRKA